MDSQESKILSLFGYKEQMKRSLHGFGSFAIAFSFISITTGVFTTYGSVLASSGPIGIWAWVIGAIGTLCVAAIFAVFATRMPLAGYSYQWVTRLSNPTLGWLMGWTILLYMIVVTVAVDYTIASSVTPELFDYVGTSLNSTVITVAIILIQTLLVCFSTGWTERINNVAVITEIVGILAISILLLVVGYFSGILDFNNLFSSGVVSTSNYNYFAGGSIFKDSPWQLAFLMPAFCIVGFEAAGNIAEETNMPGKVVPKAMLLSVIYSGIIGFIFLIALAAAGTNIPQLTASSTPVADIVIQTLGPIVGDIMLVLVIFSIFACGLVIFVSGNRVIWAMSRDQKFPGYKLFSKVSKKYDTPLNSGLLFGVICAVVMLSFSDSSNVLNNLFTASALLPALIHFFTNLLYIMKVYKKPLPKESYCFRLGKWETPVLFGASIWLIYEVSIFRDASFVVPWLYTLILLGIGVVYLFFSKRKNPHLYSGVDTVVNNQFICPNDSVKDFL